MSNSLRLLKAEQVADLLGVDKVTVYRYKAIGVLPFVKINGAVRFVESDLENLINGKRVLAH